MTRRLALTLALALCALAVPSVGAAASAPQRFTVYGTNVSFEVIDHAGNGMTVGDVYAGSNTLAGKRAGPTTGTGEWTNAIIRQDLPGGLEYRSMVFQLTWRHGALLVNGIFKADQGTPAAKPMASTLFVVGGSGRYAGARGTMVMTTLSKTAKRYDFELFGVVGAKARR